jgi:GTPase
MLSILRANGEIPIEVEEGNIEYKLKITSFDKNDIRFKKLTSQLQWRMNEGKQMYSKYIATYILGITNNGKIGNQSEEIIDESLKNLELIASNCNSQIISIKKELFNDKYYIAEVTISRLDDKFIKELRVCFVGENGSGKTTTIAHLCSGHLDNGEGSGGKLIMKHAHEQLSGASSSIVHELIGYKDEILINYKSGIFSSWEKIVNLSDFIVSLIDLPGKEKYIRTTVYGLQSRNPHIVFLTIQPNINSDGYRRCTISNETYNLLELLQKNNFNIIILFTKIDEINDDMFDDFVQNINCSIINGYHLFGKLIEFDGKIHIDTILSSLCDDLSLRIPYIKISNKTGYGFDKIHQLFNHFINKKIYNEYDPLILPTRFIIGEVYSQCNEFISNNEINIASGLMKSGNINGGEILFVGPYNNKFYQIKIKNIHKKQIDSKTLYANEYGSLEIEFINDTIPLDNHMIITKNPIELKNTCSIRILYDLNDIKLKKPFLLFSENIVESCIITEINNDIITIKFNRLPDIKVPIFSGNKCILKSDKYLYGYVV